MKISYEITGTEGSVSKIITGSELRKRFGYGPNDDIFTEQLVRKFNLIKECNGEPERVRQIKEIDL